MKITKRRVTKRKRNRIKRKYSKKRTKTRHSRKRVFSKKRRKTIKKKKRGGGGNENGDRDRDRDSTLGKRPHDNVFNFVSPESVSNPSEPDDTPWYLRDKIAAEEENNIKKLKNEKSPVLLITTHGMVTSKKFVLPFNIKKINATPIGCVVYLESGEAHNLAEQILESTKNTSSDNELAVKIKRHMGIITNITKKYFKKEKILDNDAHRFLNLPPEGHNNILTFKKDEEILDTELMTYYNKESADENTTPYYNSIMLLQENHQQIDLIPEISPRSNVEGTNVLMLSDVLDYLNSKKFKKKFELEISSLIIVDLSCSSIDSNDERFIRNLMRTNRQKKWKQNPHGGNYNYKKNKDDKKKNK